jgi:hypothetical protein
MKKYLYILLGLFILNICLSEVTLTNTQGVSLKVEILKTENGKITISRISDKKQFTINIDTLDTESKTSISKWEEDQKPKTLDTYLQVTTYTGDHKAAGSNIHVFLKINNEEKILPLNREIKEFEVKGINEFKINLGNYTTKPYDIKKIKVIVTGEDAWFLKKIYFQILGENFESNIARFTTKVWLSQEDEPAFDNEKSIILKIENKFKLKDNGYPVLN